MNRLRTIQLLRRSYGNWPSLALALLRRDRPPRSVILRDGTELGAPARRESVFLLALARVSGWEVRGGPPGHVWLGPRVGVSVIARWSMGYDIENAIEVFRDRVYDGEVRGKRVIDVGASIGDSSLFFASEGALDVLAIEPNPESFALLERNVAESSVGRSVRPLRTAAGSADGEAELRIPSGVPNAASMSPSAAALARWRFDRTVPTKVRGLGSLILGAAPERLGLLKIDAQGSEYELIGGLSPAALTLVDAIILEFTDGPRELPARLRAAGFEVTTSGTERGYLRARRRSPG